MIMVAIPIAHLLIWTNFEKAQSWGFYHRTSYDANYLLTSNLMAGFFVTGLLAFIAFIAIFELRKFFIHNCEGDTFTIESATALSRFSKSFVLYTIFSIPVETLLSIAMSFNNPVGERTLTLSFQTYNFTLIFLSFVLFTISWVIKESVNIASENAQII